MPKKKVDVKIFFDEKSNVKIRGTKDKKIQKNTFQIKTTGASTTARLFLGTLRASSQNQRNEPCSNEKLNRGCPKTALLLENWGWDRLWDEFCSNENVERGVSENLPSALKWRMILSLYGSPCACAQNQRALLELKCSMGSFEKLPFSLEAEDEGKKCFF